MPVDFLTEDQKQRYGFKNIVVTGTLRDSLVILAGLLNQETKLRPTELMTAAKESNTWH